MYIDGQFVAWQGEAWIDVINPATEEVISRIPDGSADDARKAAAYAALWLFITLLIGAFFASLSATWGGRRRDL